MSAPQRRRNGSEASCEPCRQRKIKCDHEKPVCASCRRRKLQSRCWYHPSPLSKPRGPPSRRLGPLRPVSSPTPPTSGEPFDSLTVPSGSRPSVSSGSVIEDTLRAHTWFSVLNESHKPTAPSFPRQIHAQKTYNISPEHERDVQQIISLLQNNFTQVERLIENGFSFTPISVIPPPVIWKLLASVKSTLVAPEHLSDEKAKHSLDISELARVVIRTSLSRVSISPNLDPKAFCELFCGGNLRVETLGLLCSMAARVHFDFIAAWFGEKRDDRLAHQLYQCAILSLRLARELSPQVNDIMLWLAYENTQVASTLEACVSVAVWRLLGDLATDIYSLGLHRENLQSEESVPFFLSQYRKRVFAIIFNVDKGWSAILNQPPQIPSQYVDLKPPLDISDDELFSLQSEELKQLVARALDQEGWKKVGELTSSTWARLRFLLGQVRSDLVEYQFRLKERPDETELRNISARCHEAWNSLPEHLRYDLHSAATADLRNDTRLKLARAHLSFVYVDFHIHRMISRDRGGPPTPELLQVSSKMLQGVMAAIIDRGRTPYVCDLPGDVLFYALPCAVILIAALQDAIRDPERSLPPSIQKALIFRHLSVLVCQLEGLASPGDPTYSFCIHAAKIISRKLDDILEEKLTRSVLTSVQAHDAADSVRGRGTPGGPEPPQQCTSDDITGSILGAEYAAAATTADLGHLESVDFEAWATNWGFDTGMTGTEWGIF